MKNLPPLTILFLILFSTCSKNDRKNQTNDLIEVDMNKAKEYSIKEVFEKIEIVPLETNDAALISNGTFSKVVFHENHLFVLGVGQHRISVFDNTGKHLRTFDKRGEGPGEYLGISDFEINRFTGNLEILQPNGIIFIYTLEGQFIRTVEIGGELKAVHYFKHISDDLIVLYSKFNRQRVVFCSISTGEIIKQTVDVPEYVATEAMLTPPRNPFYLFEGKVYFHEFTSNEIFLIKNTELILEYAWDFGEFNFEVVDLPDNKTREQYTEMFKTKDWVYKLTGNIENDEVRVVNFFSKQVPYTVFYNKRNSDYKLLAGKFKEGLVIPWMFDFIPKNDGMYVLMDQQYLNMCVNSEILDEDSKAKLESIQDFDNPILIKYYF